MLGIAQFWNLLVVQIEEKQNKTKLKKKKTPQLFLLIHLRLRCFQRLLISLKSFPENFPSKHTMPQIK